MVQERKPVQSRKLVVRCFERSCLGNWTWVTSVTAGGELRAIRHKKPFKVMKKVNVFLIAIAVSMLVVPSVTFASWWNPTTWFKKADVSSTTVSVEAKADNQSNIVIDLLREQITTLQKENSNLKAQVSTLNQQFAQLNEKPKTVPVQTFIPTPPAVVQTDNTALKIEKCKATKESSYNSMVADLDTQLKQKAITYQNQLLLNLSAQFPKGSLPASDLASTTHSMAMTQYNNDLQKAKTMVQSYVDDQYAKCLNN
jgi:hypothetical protein